MQVAFINPKEPIVHPHICNVCGGHFSWDDECGHYQKVCGEGYNGWEESFKICSNECRVIAETTGLIDKWYKK